MSVVLGESQDPIVVCTLKSINVYILKKSKCIVVTTKGNFFYPYLTPHNLPVKVKGHCSGGAPISLLFECSFAELVLVLNINMHEIFVAGC